MASEKYWLKTPYEPLSPHITKKPFDKLKTRTKKKKDKNEPTNSYKMKKAYGEIQFTKCKKVYA